jgi:hypothetical protein
MEAIAQRDILKVRRGTLEALANSAVPTQDRFTRTELKYVPTVGVAELRKEVDRLAKAYRELDAAIQAVHWTVDVEGAPNGYPCREAQNRAILAGASRVPVHRSH